MILQSDPAWATARLGFATASRIVDVLAKNKSGWGASRDNYAAELIVERLTRKPGDRFVTVSMQWGLDNEPAAVANYAFRANVSVGPAAFLKHPRIDWAGASPDGFIGDEGLIEVKCPNTNTHIDTVLGKKPPEKYITQMQWQMAVAERKWCDFVSFDPRLPERMSLFVHRVHRDDVLIAEMEREVEIFLSEVEDKIRQLERV